MYDMNTDKYNEFQCIIDTALNGDDLAIDCMVGMCQTYKVSPDDIDLVWKSLKILAAKGNDVAMVNIGNVYEYGELGRKQSYKRALKWYQKAAEAGNIVGEFNYGNMHHWGQGVKVNHKIAAKAFANVYAQGYTLATFYMGLYHQEGFYFKQDYKKAMEYYLEGATMDDPVCYHQIGYLYAKGYGVEKDIHQAMSYLVAAAELGDSLSFVALGNILIDGSLESNDYKESVRWFYWAACQDEDDGIKNLRKLIKLGKAKKLAEKALKAIEKKDYDLFGSPDDALTEFKSKHNLIDFQDDGDEYSEEKLDSNYPDDTKE